MLAPTTMTMMALEPARDEGGLTSFAHSANAEFFALM
jgi:hypothetical protein